MTFEQEFPGVRTIRKNELHGTFRYQNEISIPYLGTSLISTAV